MGGGKSHLFGPVASRRLGLSLGVDIVPLKTCTQNCIYCQLGLDGVVTVERKPYVDVAVVLEELRERVAGGLRADFITLSGSGEPTLNSRLGELIDGVRGICDTKIAIITNGTLLSDPAVRADCVGADVILPSLDAGDAETFVRINRPHEGIDFERFIEGLCKLRREFAGQIWLEVFFCEGVNTSDEQIAKIRGIVERIGPDKVQVNTVVRPVAGASALRVQPGRLAEIAAGLGPKAEVIVDFSRAADLCDAEIDRETVLTMLKRRPCSLDDICSGLGVDRDQVFECLKKLEKQGAVISHQRQERTFYSST